jgi:diketogulonate reductase-like aldo/keto reductase
VAEEQDATPAQVCLAWLLARENVAAIPKATGEHVEENYGALAVDLDPEDVKRIDAIEEERRMVDFDAAPWHAAD